MSSSSLSPAPTPIGGETAPGFERVRDAFGENFERYGELGAGVSAYIGDRRVVGLWGGWRDEAKMRRWSADTLVCMMSVSKGVAALCLHHLVDRGALSLGDYVARYWPEFGQAGKVSITVAQLVSHHAGLIYPDLAPPNSFLDWETMTDALARQAPEWPSGAKGAYHSSTYGHLIGELVRRADGRTIGAYFREEFAVPMGLDYHIGLRPVDLPRVADLIANPASDTLNLVASPSSPLARAYAPLPKSDPYTNWIHNWRDMRMTEFPSANGHGNAEATARLFAMLACGGVWEEKRYFAPETIARMRMPQWDEPCGLTGRRYRMAMGLFLNSPPLLRFGPNPEAFGTFGLGGAVAMVDPERRLAFSYAGNRTNSGSGLGDRCERLIEAVYDCF